jgi:apolipoprotein D and lipocalin family protein
VLNFQMCLAARRLAAAACVAGLGLCAPALADTPQPAKPVELQRLAGLWYEIARVPNQAEGNCPFATTDWQPQSGGKFLVVQTCRPAEGAPSSRVIRATANPLDPGANAKWRMSYFGGMIHRDYWVMDHGADNDWVILGMPGKNYVWVLSRQPAAPEPMREEFLQRISALGYDASRLVFAPALAGRG